MYDPNGALAIYAVYLSLPTTPLASPPYPHLANYICDHGVPSHLTAVPATCKSQ